MTNDGVLAIWNDCKPGAEADYEAWYKAEHLPERLGVPGFLTGRRYQAIKGSAPEYFTFYTLTSPEVISSALYRRRVENPTPDTTRIMTDVFLNMNRTVCRVVETAGRGHGAFAVTLALSDGLAAQGVASDMAASAGVQRAELWEAVDLGEAVSREQSIRGADDSIGACLLVETLREADALQVASRLSSDLKIDAGVYRLLCELRADEV